MPHVVQDNTLNLPLGCSQQQTLLMSLVQPAHFRISPPIFLTTRRAVTGGSSGLTLCRTTIFVASTCSTHSCSVTSVLHVSLEDIDASFSGFLRGGTFPPTPLGAVFVAFLLRFRPG